MQLTRSPHQLRLHGMAFYDDHVVDAWVNYTSGPPAWMQSELKIHIEKETLRADKELTALPSETL